MKKILLLTSIFALISGIIFAQSLKIETLEHQDVTNTSINLNSQDPDMILDQEFLVTNMGTSSVDLLVKKRHVSITEGSDTYFCMGLCYPATVFQSTNTVNLCAGCILEGLSGFSVHFRPKGFYGESQIIYTVWAVGNEADSVTITMNYKVETIGAPEYRASGSSLYPNPASSTIQFEYPFTGTRNNYLVITNLLGSKVKQLNVNDPSGRNTFNVADLTPGVYFYTIFDNGAAVKTSRLVIKR